MLDSIVGGVGGGGGGALAHYFPNSFLKLAGNEYCSKLEKEFRFQVIYTPNISYSLEFSLDI